MLALLRFAAQFVVRKGINRRLGRLHFRTSLTGKFDEKGGGENSRFQAEKECGPQRLFVNGLSPTQNSPVFVLSLPA